MDKIPIQYRLPKQIQFNESEIKVIDTKIEEMLRKRIIITAPKGDDQGEFISNIFLRPKKDGSHRVILNLKVFNENVSTAHFKMQSLQTAVQLMTKGCYMASVDWKDAYYSLPIDSNDQKYLRFYWNGVKYQYTVLPNGLSSGPRDFTKISKVLYSNLRELGFLNASYIDDSFLAGDSIIECQENVRCTVEMGLNAGFIAHPEKSVLVPTQIIEYLGFVLNSMSMKVYLTDSKKEGIKKLCKEISIKKNCKIEKIAELVGKMVATFPGVEFAPLFYRRIENEKSKALKISKGNYQAIMSLSDKAKGDIQWWIENIDKAFKPIFKTSYSIVMQTDASNIGWGGNLNGVRTGGQWSKNEKMLHINQKELMAVWLSLKSLCNEIKGQHIRIEADNTTTVAYINKMGGTKITCHEIARKIWDWAINANCWVSACHIPGSLNVEADEESRRQFNTEYQLKPSLFRILTLIWGKPQVDLFATRLNCQIKIFFAWKPDPEAQAIDALAQKWGSYNLVYAFPPIGLIGKVLQKLRSEGGDMILVVPKWPGQAWFSQMLHMLIDFIVLFPRQAALNNTTNDENRFQFLACKVSGQTTKIKDFQKMLQTLSCPLGGKLQRNNMVYTYANGTNLRLNGRRIPCIQL